MQAPRAAAVKAGALARHPAHRAGLVIDGREPGGTIDSHAGRWSAIPSLLEAPSAIIVASFIRCIRRAKGAGVTDIFFSYKSDDRERVRPVRDAFAAQGFDVFWDQQVPAGEDWDNWIRRHLAESKCAIVFWSVTSVTSANVRHEATVARQQGKLIPVLLESLKPDQFPMGLYTQQAVNLATWVGDFGNPEWSKLRREVEIKLTPLWMKGAIHELEAELVAERARREAAEARDRAFQGQVAKEAQAQIALKRELESAQGEIAVLRAELTQLVGARSDQRSGGIELQQRLIEVEASLAAAERRVADERRERLAVERFLRESEEQRSNLARQAADHLRRYNEIKVYHDAMRADDERQQRSDLDASPSETPNRGEGSIASLGLPIAAIGLASVFAGYSGHTIGGASTRDLIAFGVGAAAVGIIAVIAGYANRKS